MPRTSARPQPRITNAVLLEAVQGVKTEIAELKGVVEHSGLNSYSADFKAMVDEWRAERQLRNARRLVASDVASRLAWLRKPRWVLVTFLGAILGGLGWKIASGLHLPPGLP